MSICLMLYVPPNAIYFEAFHWYSLTDKMISSGPLIGSPSKNCSFVVPESIAYLKTLCPPHQLVIVVIYEQPLMVQTTLDILGLPVTVSVTAPIVAEKLEL